MKSTLIRDNYIQQVNERLRVESLLKYDDIKETKNISIEKLRERIKKLRGDK